MYLKRNAKSDQVLSSSLINLTCRTEILNIVFGRPFQASNSSRWKSGWPIREPQFEPTPIYVDNCSVSLTHKYWISPKKDHPKSLHIGLYILADGLCELMSFAFFFSFLSFLFFLTGLAQCSSSWRVGCHHVSASSIVDDCQQYISSQSLGTPKCFRCQWHTSVNWSFWCPWLSGSAWYQQVPHVVSVKVACPFSVSKSVLKNYLYNFHCTKHLRNII